jgi:hypothetical protein
MKKLIFILLFVISAFADVKVNLIETKVVDYPNGALGGTTFRVICINGYQWLRTGDGQGRSISQMFNNNSVNAFGAVSAKAINCENK